mmetsp:Transcript_20092/g.41139  ORF Transcript_20092/g.41139 Transcript_20092/m.41139 type:complete len:260 (+) Transcript_20092:248-1027(+)
MEAGRDLLLPLRVTPLLLLSSSSSSSSALRFFFLSSSPLLLLSSSSSSSSSFPLSRATFTAEFLVAEPFKRSVLAAALSSPRQNPNSRQRSSSSFLSFLPSSSHFSSHSTQYFLSSFLLLVQNPSSLRPEQLRDLFLRFFSFFLSSSSSSSPLLLRFFLSFLSSSSSSPPLLLSFLSSFLSSFSSSLLSSFVSSSLSSSPPFCRAICAASLAVAAPFKRNLSTATSSIDWAGTAAQSTSAKTVATTWIFMVSGVVWYER